MKITAKWEGLREWERAEDNWQSDVVAKTISEIEQAALRIERDAKNLVPVDTGDLRRSITADINKTATSVTTETGSDLDYSDVVEFGAVNQRAQPYLIPSFDRNIQSLERTLNNILKGA